MKSCDFESRELIDTPWRVGRKLGRTIYAQLFNEPSDDDPVIGIMDSEDLAKAAVELHNMAINR
jgi:hypothetical protein